MNADDAGKAVFRLEIVVPESTIDANGHVNNVHYVQWMQNAAEAHSAALGWPAARYRAIGTRQSRSRVRVPVCCVPRRDQLAKGVLVK